jgi:hypothetical protein
MIQKDNEQQKSIKLKLEQPAIMCSGRKKIECFYKGKIINENIGNIDIQVIKFKSHGQDILVTFFKGECVTEPWQDLKIYK